MKDILGFFGEHRWLSNFWPSVVVMDWEEYTTVEHAYQAAKTFNHDVRHAIRNCPKASDAKRAAPTGSLLRPDWMFVRVQVMDDLLRQKFSNPELMHKLLQTGDCLLEETNRWNDTFWGVCNGQGENNLGKLLMKIRKDLREISNVV